MNAKNAKTNESRRKARICLKTLNEKFHSIKVTIYNIAELYKGAYQSANIALNIQKVEKVIKDFEIIYPSFESMKEFARTSAELESKGITVPMFDLLIGCIVLSADDMLYTRNINHFEKIPRLNYINWESEDFSDDSREIK
ncbi:MAG TPA: hypothetical protein VKM55_07860 [Candidatus Lokiarchaeia archaeon]|nr:hypothetical protein [Candidatus Lokiarchaeia archaeon]